MEFPFSQMRLSTEENESMESLYAGVGRALIGCQMAEKLIVYCLARRFPDQPIRSVEILERMDEQNRRKMHGQLIGELRKRVELAAE